MVIEPPFPAPGDQVLVPWGLDEVLGEVVEVYATGFGDKAVVRLLGHADQEATVTVPADTLARASGPTPELSPRIDAIAYESSVLTTLQRISEKIRVRLRREENRDQGIDAIVDDGDYTAAIQVKYFGNGRVSSDTISVLAGYANTVMPIILVTNADPSGSAYNRLQALAQRKVPLWCVRWVNPDDDTKLANVIRTALAVRGRRH